jgi:hypothetical protein
MDGQVLSDTRQVRAAVARHSATDDTIKEASAWA